MVPKFTPGPWATCVLETYQDVNSISVQIEFSANELQRRFHSNSRYQEDNQNASLISDCPTLLNVLHKCFITLQGEYPKDQWEEYYPEILEAKALLEKHLGDLGLEE